MSVSIEKLELPEGALSYEVGGTGPLAILVPGMGELRSTYRYLAPLLRSAGYRVASADLRGHGDSDATFRHYGDEATAGDLAALIDRLGPPAVLVGNSMAAGAAVLVAASRPESVTALVLIGPFVRNPNVNVLQRAVLRIAMAPLWAAKSWLTYLPKLYAGAKPEDFEEYRRRVALSMRRPGYSKAFSLTTKADHSAAEGALGSVRAPTLVVMGDKDPDFPEPAAEARWVAAQLDGRVTMVADSGHYPHAQQPEQVAEAILSFLAEVQQSA